MKLFNKDKRLQLLKKSEKKYSPNQEYAILRKKLAGLDNGEFDEYNSYIEECKSKAKATLS